MTIMARKTAEGTRERRRRWEAENRERIAAVRKKWRDANRDKIAAQAKRYRERHPDRVAAREARRRGKRNAYYEANMDRLLAQHREWAKRNPDVVRKLSREWMAAHPEVNADIASRRRARMRGVPTEKIDRRVVFEREHGICHLCSQPVPFETFTIDHVIPIARGGSHTYENVKVAHKSCNSRKRDCLPGETRRRRAA